PERAAEQDRGRCCRSARDLAWRASRTERAEARLPRRDRGATNMARRYGRCPRGVRLLSSVPWGHWKTTTFVAGLRSDRLTAPCVLDGPMDGETFKAYVEQFLAPSLSPGDIVIMDNLPSHKVKGIREAIAAAGADVRYLPP